MKKTQILFSTRLLVRQGSSSLVIPIGQPASERLGRGNGRAIPKQRELGRAEDRTVSHVTCCSWLACGLEPVHASAFLSGEVPSEPSAQTGSHQAEVQVVAFPVFSLFCREVKRVLVVKDVVLVSDRGKMLFEPIKVQLATKIGIGLHGSHVEISNLFEHHCFEGLWLFLHCLLFVSENGRGIHSILR
jgi:hypothetical protein